MAKIIRNILNGIRTRRDKADLDDALAACEGDRTGQADNLISSNGKRAMQVLSSQSMSTLGGAGRLATEQHMMSMAQINNMTVHSLRLKHLLSELLPEVCRKHVYNVNHEHSLLDNYEIIKWTFFNDLSVRLKVDADFMMEDGDLRPITDDFECWQADAIMKCEAGDDVWPRPKPMESGQTPQGVSSLHSGQMNSLSSLAQQQGSLGNSINHQAVGNAFPNFCGLFK